MKHKANVYFVICMLILLFPITITSQVTMGSDKPPAKAAILQLKQWESADNQDPTDLSNSSKGLGLPRVALKSLDSLEPFLDPNDVNYNAKKKENEGLLVFNLTEDPLKNLYPRVYIWNGTLWKEYVLRTSELFLETNPDILSYDFDVLNPQALNMNLKWEPAPISTEIILDPRIGGGLQGLGTIPHQTDLSGNYNFSIKPRAITQAEIDANPLIERTTEIHFRTSNGAGAFLLKSILLKQVKYGIIVEGIDPYMEMGRDYYITIKANTPWKLNISSPKGDNNTFEIQEIPTDGLGTVTKDGVKYKLRLKEGATLERDKIVFTFSSTEGKYVDQVITFEPTRTYSNAYLVQAGNSLEIPIKKAYIVWANDLKEPLASNAAFTTELLWQDKSNLIESLSSENLGVETKLKVKLRSGVPSGNALVGAKNSEGDIVWSWHLWVTDYDPNKDVAEKDIDFGSYPTDQSIKIPTKGGDVYAYYNGKINTHFMDRDLGALTVYKDIKENGVLGMYYQWGRKDPIPGPDLFKTVNGSILGFYNHVDLYDNTKQLIHYDGTNSDVVTGINHIDVASLNITCALSLSIANPKVVYIAKAANDFDWFGSFVSNHRDDMWTRWDDTKGLYDPCPQGWRVVTFKSGLDNPFYGIDFPSLPLKTASGLNMGIDATDYIGFIPLSGQYDQAQATKPAGLGSSTLLRTATPAGSRNFSLGVQSNKLGEIRIYARGHASAVRCVKYNNDSDY